MNISNKTVLITGGGSGIGLAIAKTLSEKGSRVVIVGRNEAKLRQAAAQVPGVATVACDITNGADVTRLVQQVQTEFGDLGVLINNAGQASAYQLTTGSNAFSKAEAEMATNYLAMVRLTELLLPVLSQQPEAAVVNVSSIVAFAPSAAVPTYSASKAAVHSYTQALRHTLAKATNIRVFELMPPLVDTEFSAEIGGASGIPPQQVADELLAGLENGDDEIRVGQTAQFYEFQRASPAEAFASMNG
ncbi:SDR family NAD(P)-dependent oxidoreductase [Microvirga sp. STS02]|uniref:SDR family oxidoreductase n=1 Tax=Hymenobacter negativus TaxID=2795026 RepID=UPI0018DDF6A3|nr:MULTISPECIES: SDR family NAD(P)-dependent oxidoreductase [Bacteria]MBH8567375.1 SDR family NAD(P)-dependent oxidoreductase [Hymenobacter negativus]MBR7207107.1 SDR family NAD(P)-dependent oxidoreductase [Microvirga sp. STS02]